MLNLISELIKAIKGYNLFQLFLFLLTMGSFLCLFVVLAVFKQWSFLVLLFFYLVLLLVVEAVVWTYQRKTISGNLQELLRTSPRVRWGVTLALAVPYLLLLLHFNGAF